MSEKDRERYQKIKTDPAKWAKLLEWRKNQRIRKREKETARKRKWRAANPEDTQRIRKANHAVELALLAGELFRPDRCSRCNCECKPQGHHWSYDEIHWLDVIWLCQNCHSKEHYPG